MDIATLGISVDSRDATTAAADLDKLTATGARTEAAMGGVGAASRKANADLRSIANTAKQTSFALRQVPMQFTDIAVGLASGQSPLMVLLQQGGQLKDMFGGIGPAARAMGSYVAGLVNPFTIAAAAVGVLALAYKQGSDEQTEFGKGIVATGNFAGVTTGQLADMAAAISRQSGTTSNAAAALTMLVNTGAIYGDQLQELAGAAARWEAATGTAVKDTVAQFVQLAKDPVAASEKLNQQYHYLTLSIYEQIRALDEQGRKQEAAALAERTYATALQERSSKIVENLGWIEGGWKAIKDGAAEAWDAMLGIGREQSLDERIREARENLKELQESTANIDFYGRRKADKVAVAERALQALEAKKSADEAAAEEARRQKTIQDDAVTATSKIASIRDAMLTNAERREKALADLRANVEKIRAADPNSPTIRPANVSRLEANIRERYKDKEAKDPGITLDNIAQANIEQFDYLARKAMDTSEVMRDVARSNEAYFNGIEKSIDKARESLASIDDFLLSDEERLQASYDRRQGMLDQAHEYGLVSEERYQDTLAKLQKRYEEDAQQMHAQKMSATLQNSAQLFDGLAGLAQVFAGKQSGIYKAMFAASKAFAIADSIVKIQTGIAQAAALPFPVNLGAMATVAAATAGIVATIQGTELQGIAHSGMSNIPREGTWLLNGGERVVAPAQNRDLTRFLERQSGGQTQRGGGDFIFSPTIHTNDSRDLQRSLQRGGTLTKELRRQARNFVR